MRTINILTLLFVFYSCSSPVRKTASMNSTDTVQFNHVVTLEKDGERQTVYPDERVELAKGPFIVKAKDRLPMYLGKGKALRPISLPTMSFEILGKKANDDINKTVNSSISDIFKILDLIENSRMNEALTEIRLSKLKYPKIAYYNYLEASVYHQMGMVGEARESLEEGLRKYGNDTKAINYLKVLKNE